MHRKARVQRTPLVDISSDEDEESEKTIPVPSRQSQITSGEMIELSSHVDDFELQTRRSSSFQDYDTASDGDDEEEDVYDWLATDQSFSSLEQTHSTTISGPSTPVKNPDCESTPSETQKKEKSNDSRLPRTTFSPPGWDSPLYSKISAPYADAEIIKDTNHLLKKKVQLPDEMPEVRKGTWLTNRVVVNNYILLHSLGKGSYGEVKLCKEKRSNQLFAMKILSKNVNANTSANGGKNSKQLPVSELLNGDVRREVEIMKKLQHENVIRLYEVIDNPKSSTLYLVLEYMRADLMQIVKKESMNDEQTWDILRQVVRGLNYLHSNDIVHFDLKPSNLLLDFNGTVKLSDFGISQIKCDGDLLTEHIGTPAFMAPEIIAGGSYDGKKTDIYSVGATAYFIRFGEPAFKGRSRNDLFQKIMNDPVRFPEADNASVGLRRLILILMTKTPSIRLTMDKLVIYPWLQNRPHSGDGIK